MAGEMLAPVVEATGDEEDNWFGSDDLGEPTPQATA
jgi:hypothetical protein